MTRCALLLSLAFLAACGSDGGNVRSDWEEANAARLAKEGAEAMPDLPPAPRKTDLVEFSVGAASDFRFYIDSASFRTPGDGILRYVLVARSPAGAENVAFEALNCRSLESRVYALGRGDGTWTRISAPWRQIGTGTPAQRVLAREFFCPRGIAVATHHEGVMALRRGGHPLADQPNPVSGGGR